MKVEEILKEISENKDKRIELAIQISPLKEEDVKLEVRTHNLKNLLNAIRNLCEHVWGNTYMDGLIAFRNCKICQLSKRV